jgi:DUF4097 and DUF4098 domain-containing protein YvlB
MRLLTASALLVSLAAPAAAAAQKETETVDRTVTIGESGNLKLRNFDGDVRISAAPGRDVIIHAVRRGTKERLQGIKLEISSSGSNVAIEANHRAAGWRDDKDNNVVETDFDIKVPPGTKLDLYTFAGSLEVTGVIADIKAETFSGKIALDVSAAPKLPTLTAETFSGNIETRVPASASGTVRFASFSGSVRSDLPISMTSGRNRWGGGQDVNGQIGGGEGPTLRFKTFSGDLRIQK